MTLTDRDRKIVMALIPVLLLVAYWFLLLGPKRSDSSKLGDDLARQEVKRDKAQQQVAALKAAQNSFAEDYSTVVKLGKAIPTSVDMPSLIVQLNAAAKGTDISFERIKVGERQSASAQTGSTAATPSGSSSTSSAGSSSSPPASAAGGEKASTGAGKAAEKANNAKATADAKTAQSGGTGSSPSSGSSSGSATPTGASVPGLDSVPLEFTFKGGFFNLADFFHQLKRFVRVANERIAVRGRLMAINGFTFKASAFPRLEAQVFATVYLSPKEQGATAGATPGGPSSSSAAGSTPASSGSGGSAPAPPTTPPAAVSAR